MFMGLRLVMGAAVLQKQRNVLNRIIGDLDLIMTVRGCYMTVVLEFHF